jgi:hypothetical protein
MTGESGSEKPAPNYRGRLNGGRGDAHKIPGRRGAKVTVKPVKPILGIGASAALRDRLVAEVRAIASSDDATTWAHRILGPKNTLIAADARKVEDAFQARLASTVPHLWPKAL